MTKLQVTKASIYGKGGKLVPVGTTIDSKKVANGLASLSSRVIDPSFVVATPAAATEAEPAKVIEPVAGEPAKGDEAAKVEQLDREQLEASAKTLGVKFTKSTTDAELFAAINEKLGE